MSLDKKDIPDDYLDGKDRNRFRPIVGTYREGDTKDIAVASIRSFKGDFEGLLQANVAKDNPEGDWRVWLRAVPIVYNRDCDRMYDTRRVGLTCEGVENAMEMVFKLINRQAYTMHGEVDDRTALVFKCRLIHNLLCIIASQVGRMTPMGRMLVDMADKYDAVTAGPTINYGYGPDITSTQLFALAAKSSDKPVHEDLKEFEKLMSKLQDESLAEQELEVPKDYTKDADEPQGTDAEPESAPEEEGDKQEELPDEPRMFVNRIGLMNGDNTYYSEEMLANTLHCYEPVNLFKSYATYIGFRYSMADIIRMMRDFDDAGSDCETLEEEMFREYIHTLIEETDWDDPDSILMFETLISKTNVDDKPEWMYVPNASRG